MLLHRDPARFTVQGADLPGRPERLTWNRAVTGQAQGEGLFSRSLGPTRTRTRGGLRLTGNLVSPTQRLKANDSASEHALMWMFLLVICFF